MGPRWEDPKNCWDQISVSWWVKGESYCSAFYGQAFIAHLIWQRTLMIFDDALKRPCYISAPWWLPSELLVSRFTTSARAIVHLPCLFFTWEDQLFAVLLFSLRPLQNLSSCINGQLSSVSMEHEIQWIGWLLDHWSIKEVLFMTSATTHFSHSLSLQMHI